MISDLRAYIRSNKSKIINFIIIGVSAAGLNLSLFYVLINFLGFGSMVMQNIANAASMELSIIFNFILSRSITWKNAQKEKNLSLIIQILKFHAVVGVGILLRLLLFPVLQHIKVFNIINVAIGIGLASVINFIFYNHLVFKSEKSN